MLSLRSGEAKRFTKFCAVGATAFVFHQSLLAFLTEVAGLPYLLSGAISTETAILYVFAFNEMWTFADLRPIVSHPLLVRAGMFNLARLGGLLLTMGVLFVATEFGGLHYLLSNVVAVAVATLFNYWLGRRWVWATR